MAFRIGQKVVYVGHKYTNNPITIQPKQEEIVTIEGTCNVYNNCYFIKEYPKDLEGNRQSFTERSFEPLILDHEFVEEVIKQVRPKEQEA